MNQYKYLKYKSKYLRLKQLRIKQSGGTIPIDSDEWFQVSDDWSDLPPDAKHVCYNGLNHYLLL